MSIATTTFEKTLTNKKKKGVVFAEAMVMKSNRMKEPKTEKKDQSSRSRSKSKSKQKKKEDLVQDFSILG